MIPVERLLRQPGARRIQHQRLGVDRAALPQILLHRHVPDLEQSFPRRGVLPQVLRRHVVTLDGDDRDVAAGCGRDAEQADAGVEIGHRPRVQRADHVLDERVHQEPVALKERPRCAGQVTTWPRRA